MSVEMLSKNWNQFYEFIMDWYLVIADRNKEIAAGNPAA
jgi:hypothetical protein